MTLPSPDPSTALIAEQFRRTIDLLRTVQDSATQFKVLAGLPTGGGLLSIIVLIRTLAGIP